MGHYRQGRLPILRLLTGEGGIIMKRPTNKQMDDLWVLTPGPYREYVLYNSMLRTAMELNGMDLVENALWRVAHETLQR